jgi:hypothetical protein
VTRRRAIAVAARPAELDPGLEVVYEHDGRRYRDTMPDALSVCVVARPQPRDAEDCAFPGTPPGKVD